MALQRERLLAFQSHASDKGALVALEGGEQIPFEIRRVFYIYYTPPGIFRGKHSNRKTEFVLLCAAGSAEVRVHDGAQERAYILDKPDCGLYLPKLLWKEMLNFSPDCVMFALCSESYDAEEYIYDFAEFMKEVAEYA